MRIIDAFAACLFAACLPGGAPVCAQERHAAPDFGRPAAARGLPRSAAVDKVRLLWPLVPGAVRYQIVLLSAPAHTAENVLGAVEAHTAGAEIALSALRGFPPEKAYWVVGGLSLDGKAVAPFSEPRPLLSGERFPRAPHILSDYADMAQPPLYLVYAWVPVLGAAGYEVEVVRAADVRGAPSVRVRRLYGYEPVLFDETPLTRPGLYAWRVRALDGGGRRYSDWSEPELFAVRAPVRAAALGDSVTHGGGAMETPPSRTLYCWETYAGLPVKNLGRSGDRAADMLDRFESDVLPFAPQALVIMGGINDIRAGTPARDVIERFTRLADKCRAHGITPVFAAAPPLHPGLMAAAWDVETPAPGWREELSRLNEWILAQPYAVDTAAPRTDEEGFLRASFTTDGLHPDAEAKRIIGEAIGSYLRDALHLS